MIRWLKPGHVEESLKVWYVEPPMHRGFVNVSDAVNRVLARRFLLIDRYSRI